jgi:hypothetical protein
VDLRAGEAACGQEIRRQIEVARAGQRGAAVDCELRTVRDEIDRGRAQIHGLRAIRAVRETGYADDELPAQGRARGIALEGARLHRTEEGSVEHHIRRREGQRAGGSAFGVRRLEATERKAIYRFGHTPAVVADLIGGVYDADVLRIRVRVADVDESAVDTHELRRLDDAAFVGHLTAGDVDACIVRYNHVTG